MGASHCSLKLLRGCRPRRDPESILRPRKGAPEGAQASPSPRGAFDAELAAWVRRDALARAIRGLRDVQKRFECSCALSTVFDSNDN